MEVTFNELNISRDSRTLSVDATVTNGQNENFIITRIAVDTCATFNEMLGHPSDNVIVSQTYSALNARLIKTDNYLFQNKILFVWVECTDSTAEIVAYRLAAVVNWYKVYETAMCYVKSLTCCCKQGECKPPVKFVDFILKVKGIDYALQTGNYTQAIQIWKSLYTKKASSPSANCGCC